MLRYTSLPFYFLSLTLIHSRHFRTAFLGQMLVSVFLYFNSGNQHSEITRASPTPSGTGNDAIYLAQDAKDSMRRYYL